MKYYRIIADDARYSNRWFLDEPCSVAGDELDAREFCYGKAYVGAMPAVVPVQQRGRPVAFTLAAFDMPVVTEEIAIAIQRIASTEVELFPVSVEGAPSQYFILNSVIRLPCVDELRSRIMKWKEDDGRPDKVGQYRMVTNLRINPLLAQGHHVFRITDWEVSLIVSQTFRDAIESASAGITFELVSN